MYRRIFQRLRSLADSSGESLRGKIFHGGVWLGTGMIGEQSVRFARNMLLARLLAPSAFGTMAIVTSASSMLHSIMELGIRDAVIQNPRAAEDEYVRAAWLMSFGRGLGFWAMMCLAAPFFAAFYRDPQLKPLFVVSALGIVFDGAISSRAHIAVKNLQFRKWALINHGGSICGVFITIVLSFFFRDVWALVIGFSSESIARCILSFIFYPFLPRLKWYGAATRDLWSYTKKMFGVSLLNLMFSRADVFVLAKVDSATSLGLYTMAVNLIQTPMVFLMNLLGQTIFPALARVQSDYEHMNRILLKVSQAIVFFGLPGIVFAKFFGRPILAFAYGRLYSSAAGAFVLACAVALLNILNAQITSAFCAIGKPNIHRQCVLLMAITMLVVVYPSIKHFGIVGGQLACLVAVVVGLLFQLFRIHRCTHLQLSSYAKLGLLPVLASSGALAGCLIPRYLFVPGGPWGAVACGLVSCLLVYGISAGVPRFWNRDVPRLTS